MKERSGKEKDVQKYSAFNEVINTTCRAFFRINTYTYYSDCD